METSSPTLEESYRRATTQGPIIEMGFTRISRAGIPKRPLPNCQSRVRLLHQRHSFSNAQMPWGGHPLVWAGLLTTSLRGLWVSGLPATVQWRTERKGGDPKTDQEGTTRTPGWHPEEKAP